MLVKVGMERVLLCALNAKYIHSSLALRSLQAYNLAHTKFDIRIKEFTINQKTMDIMADIYLTRPDVLGFSCYIWNIKPILELCADYKKVAPRTIIVLGGPEVSYDAKQLLYDNPFIDYVIRGEGEATLKELLGGINGELPRESIKGISYRDQGQIFSNPDRELIPCLDDIPFAYRDEMNQLSDRVVYYESSRGCPFRCTYCLSSNSPGMRNLSLERVKSDLDMMLDYQVREIKFVDRTFNCDEKRAREIMDFIISRRSKSKVHLEIDAGLFSDSMLDYLAGVPPNLFNFEIGVQSTFKPALDAVRRNFNWDRLSHNINRLRSYHNIHLHLDLIAGLPGENYETFKRSFDMVYNLKPDMLQLGFLKILKGTPLQKECDRYGYVYQSHSPYQILSNHAINYEEIMTLTCIEEILAKYYNSSDMMTAVDYVGQVIYAGNAMSFYEDFSRYWLAQRWVGIGHKKEILYSYLQMFVDEKHSSHREIVNELLKYDYLCCNHRYGLPKGLYSHNPPNINDLIYSYTKDKLFLSQHLTAFEGKTAGEIKKLVHIEYFKVDPRTFKKVDNDLMLMFVYNPITKIADKIIELE